MAHTKGKHYWAQLRAALTGGLWGSPTPAKAYNGSTVSWSELLRKFNKHNHGYSDVAEIASQTQALALLIAGGPSEAELDGDSSEDAPLSLGEECYVSEGRMEDAKQVHETLKSLESESPNSDSLKLALAYCAFALQRHEECLSYLNSVQDLADAHAHLNPSVSLRSTASSMLTVPAPSVTETSIVSFTGSFVSMNSSSSIADIRDGRAWAAVEVMRSICLQGMSDEVFAPNEPQKILSVYLTAAQGLPTLEAEISRTSPPNPAPASGVGQGRIEFASFTRYRELWRWIERLLWRAIIVASRICALGGADETVLWALFAHYQTCSAHWPPTFRPNHRSTISVLYLRALILRSRLPGLPPLPSSASMISQMQDFSAPAWLPAARRAVREYRDILSVCTHFPRAGERNVKVEEFVDLCVAVWVASGASGEHAGWVIDILWWATRLTFNSHRVFMHMARICAAAGDFLLARRTLRLYWQVVSKAREAGTDADTDVNWVTTLVWGARMLCRLALVVDSAKGLEGVADAREAGVLIEKARTRLDAENKELSASVDLAEGIWNTVMAIVEQDHFTRSSRLQAAMALLERSIEANPTASAYYHLALAYYRPIPGRDLDRAIQNARCAVEIESNEVRYWHLLGLLLVASEDWSGAKGVLEVGCAIDEQYWSGQTPEDKGAEAQSEPTTNGDTTSGGDRLHPDSAIGRTITDGIATRDFGAADSSIQTQTEEISSSTSRPRTPLQSGPVLDPSADDVPPAATLLGPLPDHPNPNRLERFEHALQLRMSQLALTELLEGPEGAGEKWVEVFGWFAEKKGVGKDASQRTSIDTTRQSVEIKSEIGLANGVQPHDAQHEGPADGSDYPQTPVPITFTPATPHEPDQQSFEEKTPRNSHEDGGKEKQNPGKKVQKMLKNRVHKGQQRITTIGKKIGHGVGRSHSLNLRRTTSTPAEFYTLLSQHYQASSIHSRRQFSPFGSAQELPRPEAPPSPPPPEIPPREHGERSRKERKLLSDLWLMSAATFRRSGKIEQARGAIQEAEVRDEENPAVWVQLGLYYTALGNRIRAIQAFNKALFISPDNIPATIHLCQQYLSLTGSLTSYEAIEPEPDHVDLAAGMLTDLTKGAGWDVAEAWYFLGKAHGIRGMRDRERECLNFALGLSEGRPLRDIGAAVGWSL